MKTAAFPAPSIPAPAFALAAVPALLTVGVIGLLLVMTAPSPAPASPGRLPDPFVKWTDKRGVTRELKFLDVQPDRSGTMGRFEARDGSRLFLRFSDLAAADEERAWEAVFAIPPVAVFKQATVHNSYSLGRISRYEARYGFEVFGLPVRSIKDGSLSINRAPIADPKSMHEWKVELTMLPQEPMAPLGSSPSAFDLVRDGFRSPPLLKGVPLEGSFIAICGDEVVRETLALPLPGDNGSVSKAKTGPLELRLEKSWPERDGPPIAELKISEPQPGHLIWGGFVRKGAPTFRLTTEVQAAEEALVVEVYYHTRLREVKVPFFATGE